MKNKKNKRVKRPRNKKPRPNKMVEAKLPEMQDKTISFNVPEEFQSTEDFVDQSVKAVDIIKEKAIKYDASTLNDNLLKEAVEQRFGQEWKEYKTQGHEPKVHKRKTDPVTPKADKDIAVNSEKQYPTKLTTTKTGAVQQSDANINKSLTSSIIIKNKKSLLAKLIGWFWK